MTNEPKITREMVEEACTDTLGIDTLRGYMDQQAERIAELEGQIVILMRALKFYANNCPQSSLDGPEGYPTALRAKNAIADIKNRATLAQQKSTTKEGE